MYVSIFSKMAYENNYNWTLGENKPNQTQFHYPVFSTKIFGFLNKVFAKKRRK